MEAHRRHSSRSWYKPDPRIQAARMAVVEEAKRNNFHSRPRLGPAPQIQSGMTNYRSNTRTRYRQAATRNLMESSPQSPRRQRSQYTPTNFNSLGGSVSATSSAERYGAPKHRRDRAHRGDKRPFKPVSLQYAPANNVHTSRSWYLPKRPVPLRYAKRVDEAHKAKYVKSRGGRDHLRRSGGSTSYVLAADTGRRDGLVKGWYGAFRRMFQGL